MEIPPTLYKALKRLLPRPLFQEIVLFHNEQLKRFHPFKLNSSSSDSSFCSSLHSDDKNHPLKAKTTSQELQESNPFLFTGSKQYLEWENTYKNYSVSKIRKAIQLYRRYIRYRDRLNRNRLNFMAVNDDKDLSRQSSVQIFLNTKGNRSSDPSLIHKRHVYRNIRNILISRIEAKKIVPNITWLKKVDNIDLTLGKVSSLNGLDLGSHSIDNSQDYFTFKQLIREFRNEYNVPHELIYQWIWNYINRSKKKITPEKKKQFQIAMSNIDFNDSASMRSAFSHLKESLQLDWRQLYHLYYSEKNHKKMNPKSRKILKDWVHNNGSRSPTSLEVSDLEEKLHISRKLIRKMIQYYQSEKGIINKEKKLFIKTYLKIQKEIAGKLYKGENLYDALSQYDFFSEENKSSISEDLPRCNSHQSNCDIATQSDVKDNHLNLNSLQSHFQRNQNIFEIDIEFLSSITHLSKEQVRYIIKLISDPHGKIDREKKQYILDWIQERNSESPNSEQVSWLAKELQLSRQQIYHIMEQIKDPSGDFTPSKRQYIKNLLESDWNPTSENIIELCAELKLSKKQISDAIRRLKAKM